MSVIVRFVRHTGESAEFVTHPEGSYTDIGGLGELMVYNKDEVEIAVYHQDQWASARVETEKTEVQS